MHRIPKLPLGRKQGAAGSVESLQCAADASIVLGERRLICSNAVFSVYFDRLEQPDGRQVVDYLSIFPKTSTQDGISGVAILPEFDGKIGLVHVFRHPLRVAAWEIPRGFVDPHESVPDAALRELREEMHMKTADLVDLGRLAPEPGMFAGRVQLYLARRCARVRAKGAKELGHGALHFFSSSEVARLIAEDKIQDPCTLVAYLKYRQAARRGTKK